MRLSKDLSLLAIKSIKGGGGGGSTGITDININQNNELTYTKDGQVHVVGTLADGDMDKAVYDVDNPGKVDDAEKVNGKTVETSVPADAVFTDTVYDDTELRNEVDNKVSAEVTGEKLVFQK
jgi:hypothetical protein